MTLVRRYAGLLWVQARASLLRAMQYRGDFLIEGGVELLWVMSAFAPLLVVYGARERVAGWSYAEALVVAGWFTMLQGVIEGAISPGMTTLVEHIRKGTLDFVLLKPADAQFLVSTGRIQPWKFANVVTGLAIIGYGLVRHGRVPSVWDVGQAAVMLVVSTSLLYALWMCAACAAFVLVKVDNLTFLFSAVFDAARWPSAVFPGLLRLVFTVVIPLAVMTTFPAEALLGRLEAWRMGAAVCGAAGALVAVRLLFRRALGGYTSAGG